LYPVVGAVFFSWVLLGFTSALFYEMRRRRNLEYGFGTELFALLVAVDLAILLGVVDPTACLAFESTRRPLPIVVAALLAGTLYLAQVALRYEEQAVAAWQTFETAQPSLGQRQQLTYLILNWVPPMLRVWFVRMVAGTSHLAFVAKVPKWWALS